MIDTHAHLNFHAFKNDVETVIENALKEGVTAIINVGTKLDSSQKAIILAQNHQQLYAAVGIHPHHADEYSEENLEKLKNLATQNKVVAIGEIGLDNHTYESSAKPTTSKDLQVELFEKSLSLALDLNLPVIIHNREAFNEIFEIISKYKSLKGVFHCWSEGLKEAQEILKLGFLISFTGIVTFKNAQNIQEVAKTAPLEKILIETDSPFLSPEPLRGLRNEPKNVKIIAEKIAQLRSISTEEVIKQTTLNAQSLFSI